MFETQTMEAGDIASVQQDRVNIMRLRSSLDLCSEELPILLELGQVGDLIKQDYNFPYHVPSLISLATASSSQMPETIGYCLLQVGDAWWGKKISGEALTSTFQVLIQKHFW